MTGIRERLGRGDVVLGAEGYLFELERRGYVKSGPFVPEVVLDFPDAVRELHREFLRAGAEVMVAFTYYGHREKLRSIGREDDLEPLNRDALRIAQRGRRRGRRARCRATSATRGSTTRRTRRARGRRCARCTASRSRWAVEEGADLIDRRDERLPRRGADRARGDPGGRAAVRRHVRLDERDDDRRLRARRRVPAARATGRRRRRAQLLARARRRCCRCWSGSGPRSTATSPRCRCRTARPRASRPSSRCAGADGTRGVPARARAVPVHALRDGRLRHGRDGARRDLPRHLLRRSAAPRPRDGRGASAARCPRAATRPTWRATPCSARTCASRRRSSTNWKD